MSRTALITGISGQDGSYLAELLLSHGYNVCGIVRRNSTPEFQTGRLTHILSNLTLFYGDVTDPASLNRIVSDVQPDEVYNLAAQSHVRISFDVSHYTTQTNAVGVLNVLEAVRRHAPNARTYQASSSEMFGNSIDPDGYQRETTPMHPVSPYGCAKLFGLQMSRHYRRAHGMFVCNGILFNHESPRRGANFVTQKIIRGAVEISLGRANKLVLGNLDSKRDWGHSADYVRAMSLMLRHPKPDDYVIATGETHSVRDLCQHVFSRLDMDYRDFVKQDERYMRPEELEMLRGDASKAQSVLGWEPQVTYEQLLDEMIEHARRNMVEA